MKGHIIKDWTKIDWRNPAHRRQVSGALQYFLALPDKFVPKVFENVEQFKKDRNELRTYIGKLQEFTTTGDMPTSILPLIEKYHVTPNYDNTYEEIFDIRDFSASRRNGFEMLDVESGLTFRKVLPGGKLKTYQFEGSKSTVYFDYYGGALNWHRQLFDDEEYWTIEDNAIEFRNKAYQFRASVFYALIEALPTAQNIAWQNPDPALLPNTDATYTANRDAQTLNTAAQTILLNVRNKGYGVTAQNASFIILAPIQLRGRIKRAMANLLQPTAGSLNQVDYNFQLRTTMMLATTSVYYVILPKKKLKGGYRQDLTLFSDFDILSYSDTQAGWMRYGGAIGDTQQIQRCAIA